MGEQSILDRLTARLSSSAAPTQRSGAAVYGTITSGAVLAAEVGRHETFADDLLAVVVALLLYWLAHAYAEALGDRLEHGHAMSTRQVLGHVLVSSSFLQGAGVPVVVLVVAHAAGATTNEAVTAALVTAAATLLVLEAIAGLRRKASIRQLSLQVAVGAVLGGGLLAMRALLH